MHVQHLDVIAMQTRPSITETHVVVLEGFITGSSFFRLHSSCCFVAVSVGQEVGGAQCIRLNDAHHVLGSQPCF